ncbi:MAG: hypothetical protein IJ386_00745 [Clostridia bacterium]|nr:hypothetical protein [Clostridia bacterium]
MFSFKKTAAAILSAAVCLGASAAAGAVGTDEVSVSAKLEGAYELRIDLKNTSEYYLANVDINVSGATGNAKVKSFGFTGIDSNSVRVVAPGENVAAYATIDSSSITAATSKAPEKTTVTTPKPTQSSNTGSSSQNNQSQNDQTPSQNGGSSDNSNGNVDNGYDNNGAGNQVQPDEPIVDNGGQDETVAGSETETTTDVTGSETGTEETSDVTTIHTIHSMAPGEETTIYASLAGGSEDGSVQVMPSEEIPPYTLWIALGVVAVLGASAFIVIKKKKKNGKDGDGGDDNDGNNDGNKGGDGGSAIASVIVIALLLSSLVSNQAVTVVAADELKNATAGSVSQTVNLSGGNGSIVITVNYTVVPKAVENALKNNRRPPAGDECDAKKVAEQRIVPGAGPLTDYKIYVGTNGFMYYGQAIDDYTGASVLGETRLAKFVKMMNDRDAWAKENDIKLYLVIAPNKSSVYPEYVPDKVKAADKTNADMVIERLAAESTVEVIDLRQPLINAKSEYGDSLFYKYDTHWNNNGGFVGYTEIMRRINEDVAGAYTLKKNDFTITEHETYMKDMAYYLGYYSNYEDYGPVYTLTSGMTASIAGKGEADRHGQFRFCSSWNDGYSDALKYVRYINHYNEGAPSVYMYRDSFSVSMLHFIKDSFYKSTFDWSYEFNKDELLQSGADVVIMEVVEKQLTEFVNTRTFS